MKGAWFGVKRVEAATGISPGALESAREAVLARAREYLEEAGRITGYLERLASRPLGPEETVKVARAVCLLILGLLPVRPETCPFCVQYGKRRSCKGCGYAASHGGRCDVESSAFYQFIEAYHELGSMIFQHQAGPDSRAPVGLEGLVEAVGLSCSATSRLVEDLEGADVCRLMELKAGYLRKMVGLLPLATLGGVEVEGKRQEVIEKLEGYW